MRKLLIHDLRLLELRIIAVRRLCILRIGWIMLIRKRLLLKRHSRLHLRSNLLWLLLKLWYNLRLLVLIELRRRHSHLLRNLFLLNRLVKRMLPICAWINLLRRLHLIHRRVLPRWDCNRLMLLLNRLNKSWSLLLLLHRWLLRDRLLLLINFRLELLHLMRKRLSLIMGSQSISRIDYPNLSM